jgi:hypothetical protein
MFELCEAFMSELGLADIDHAFAAAFVSNPHSGELIKGHAIVLAELGLCAYHGKPVRDPSIFKAPWSKVRRAEHLISRLAFTQEFWAMSGYESVTLYRGAAFEGPPAPTDAASFVSATFSREVADAHFSGTPNSSTAMLWRQRTPVDRLLATFIESRTMSEQFREAEAILIGQAPGSSAF